MYLKEKYFFFYYTRRTDDVWFVYTYIQITRVHLKTNRIRTIILIHLDFSLKHESIFNSIRYNMFSLYLK